MAATALMVAHTEPPSKILSSIPTTLGTSGLQGQYLGGLTSLRAGKTGFIDLRFHPSWPGSEANKEFTALDVLMDADWREEVIVAPQQGRRNRSTMSGIPSGPLLDCRGEW